MLILCNILLTSHTAFLQNLILGTQPLPRISSTDNRDTLPKDNHQPKDNPLRVTQPKDNPLQVTQPKDKPLQVTHPKDKPRATLLQVLQQLWPLTWEPQPPSPELSLLPSRMQG